MQRLKKKPLLMRLETILQRLSASVDRIAVKHNQSPSWLATLAWMVGLALLLSLLSSCTTTRIVRPPLPPQAEPRLIPTFDGETWRDVLYYVVEIRGGWQACEADKGAIRAIYKVPAR